MTTALSPSAEAVRCRRPRLTLRITLPDRPVLTEAAVVSRSNGGLVTVRFLGLGSYERFRILDFLEEQG